MVRESGQMDGKRLPVFHLHFVAASAGKIAAGVDQTWQSSQVGVKSLAVDGVLLGQDHCANTAEETMPWWAVYLQEGHVIVDVIIQTPSK